MSYKRKLIEVALPLDAISAASAREKSIRHGHPSTLHLWWARRPLAAARAVLWASLVDDPSAHPDRFPTEEDQAAERRRLFGILERLVLWKNSNDPVVLAEARAEVEASCDGELPNVLDPFCGGGTIPLEAQRLGLPGYGGDLNPVAVLISKALVEMPPRFHGLPPVNPDARDRFGSESWERAQGLADDIGYYGRWMRHQAFERIGQLYPDATGPGGEKLTPVAWIWARTVQSPDPAWPGHVPLVASWVLRNKSGSPKVWVEPIIDRDAKTVGYRIREGGEPTHPRTVTRGKGVCIATGSAIPGDYIKSESRAGRMGEQLMAIVAEGRRGRAYCEPTADCSHSALVDIPTSVPRSSVALDPRHIWVTIYGLDEWWKLFTPRQLVALTTFSDLLGEVRQQVRDDALAADMENDRIRLHEAGTGADAYADAVVTYMAFVVDKCADYWSALCTWHNSRHLIRNTFGRQAIPMVWDFAEANPFSGSSGNWMGQVTWVRKAVAAAPGGGSGEVLQRDALARIDDVDKPLVCTDPPYYDNISYADLSDFFYVWLRRNLREVWPEETATVLTPKSEEMIANPYRAGSKDAARQHFEDGIAGVLDRLAVSQSPRFPATIFYAYKQQETKQGEQVSTGWETFLQGLVDAKFQVTGTWPVRTELSNKLLAQGGAAVLASSVVIAGRPRQPDAPLATRREFLDALQAGLPQAVRLLQDQTIAPVDMAQSAIGPGMEVFSQYAKVLEADGSSMKVRTALAIINEALEEVLSAEETEFDSDTRWALTWYEQFGGDPAPFGDAETLSKAKNTSVVGVVQAGIAESKAGKVRLISRDELDEEWDPLTDRRLTVWEVAQHLIARLGNSETEAAELLRKVGGGMGDRARRLAYLLYQVADRKRRSDDAVAYNGLIQAWHDIERRAVARQGPVAQTFEGM
ncbi:MAG: DUF1156 domain-containing protein [bacterium]|nr:DUF1156 domain-containing protein [bacterium]MDE0290007.1 DUF1156 domain-containing protein [bacterium]